VVAKRQAPFFQNHNGSKQCRRGTDCEDWMSLILVRDPTATWQITVLPYLKAAADPGLESPSLSLSPHTTQLRPPMASDGNDRNAGSNAHSNPIAIITHPRRRSASVSSISSGSSLEPQTPASWNPARIATASPSSSPILSYFLGQSPTAKCHPNPLVIKSKFDTSTVPEGMYRTRMPPLIH